MSASSIAFAPNDYVLTSEDLFYDDTDSAPIIRASRNANSAVLTAILRLYRTSNSSRDQHEYSPNYYNVGEHSIDNLELPLLEAIKAGLPRNVELLLSAGASPDGFPLQEYSDSAGLALRPFQWNASQWISPATSLEWYEHSQSAWRSNIEARGPTIMPFWATWGRAGQGVLGIPGSCLNALMTACEQPSSEVFEIIMMASPDISAWVSATSSVSSRTHHKAITEQVLTQQNLPLYHHQLG